MKRAASCKKGFTLVELMVVIAIIAILATVSVVGYTGLVQKSKNSNANTSLSQAMTLISAELIDGSTKSDSGNTANIKMVDNKLYAGTAAFDADDLKAIFSDIAAMSGTFTVTVSNTETADKGYQITKIKYEENGGSAEIDLTNGI